MRPQHEYDEAMRWLAMGLSSRETANVMKIPKATIDSWRRFGRGAIKSGSNHSWTTYEEAMRYSALGMNDCEISRLMDIPHGTIGSWRRNGLKLWAHNDTQCPICGRGTLNEKQYAYLLGMYLGDGYIVATHRGVYRLSIFLDLKYPRIIDECRHALIKVRTNGSDKVTEQEKDGCVALSASWKHWPCLFPQHGPGMKHTRSIKLENWQEEILLGYSQDLLRGLIHSDGSRGVNTIRTEASVYRYPRYEFSNHSKDIQRIFTRACDTAGIRWKQMNWKSVAISRREEVAKMDEFIGPKR